MLLGSSFAGSCTGTPTCTTTPSNVGGKLILVGGSFPFSFCSETQSAISPTQRTTSLESITPSHALRPTSSTPSLDTSPKLFTIISSHIIISLAIISNSIIKFSSYLTRPDDAITDAIATDTGVVGQFFVILPSFQFCSTQQHQICTFCLIEIP